MKTEIDVGSNCTITYIDKAIVDRDYMFDNLYNNLEWVQIEKTPRKEYYCNESGLSYTYGSGRGVRTYLPQPWTLALIALQNISFGYTGVRQEVLFLNRYDNNRDQLGWHADDSPEMDDSRPITIISLGAEREIMFRSNDNPDNVIKLVLGHGSVCIMPPGMQDTHQHRIPKSGDARTLPRISLTFRGLSK